jgi:molybdenum cofactor cytidylyltransferase
MTTEAPTSLDPESSAADPSRLEAIVLAGGAGTRFGGRKLTAAWRGGRLIDGALAAAFAAPARAVTVVTGADPGVVEAAQAFAARAGETARLRLVHAQDHTEGMAATLRAGVASLPADTSGVFVFLGDMPLIPRGVAAALAEALTPGKLAAVPTFGGRRGHPALFHASTFPALRGLTGDQGARSMLRDLGDKLAETPAPGDGVLFDVDTPQP